MPLVFEKKDQHTCVWQKKIGWIVEEQLLDMLDACTVGWLMHHLGQTVCCGRWEHEVILSAGIAGTRRGQNLVMVLSNCLQGSSLFHVISTSTNFCGNKWNAQRNIPTAAAMAAGMEVSFQQQKEVVTAVMQTPWWIIICSRFNTGITFECLL